MTSITGMQTPFMMVMVRKPTYTFYLLSLELTHTVIADNLLTTFRASLCGTALSAPKIMQALY